MFYEKLYKWLDLLPDDYFIVSITFVPRNEYSDYPWCSVYVNEPGSPAIWKYYPCG